MQVVLAAKGYPGSYQKGSVIGNLGDIQEAKVTQLTHSAQETESSRTFQHLLNNAVLDGCCSGSEQWHPAARAF